MKRDVVITIKITEEERRELDRRCKGSSRSKYIRELIFSENISDTTNVSKQEKDLLQHVSYISHLLRFLTTSLDKKDLVLEAKEAANDWYEKHYKTNKTE